MKQKNFLKIAMLFILTLIYSNSIIAQTTLEAGDLAIIGYNGDNPDQFSFVLLVDVTTNTEITFTDSGVKSDDTFRGGEGGIKFTASTNYSAGTIITYTGPQSDLPSGDFTEANDSNVGNNDMNLSGSGDQIFAFQGSSSTPTFIFGFQSNSNIWQTDATGSTNSALPSTLTNGVNAVAVGSGSGAGSEFDNSVYDEALTSGSKASILAVIVNNSNWDGNNSRITFNFSSYTITSSTTTWTGASNTDWATAGNWNNGVPSSSLDATIPDLANAPIISGSTNASVNDLTITEPDGINITAGGSLIVSGTSTGNVTYNRTLDFVSGNANGWHLISSPVAAQTYNNDYAETNGLATSGTKRGLAFYNDALASGSKYTYLLSDDSNTSSFNTGVYSGSGIGYSAKRASTTGTVAFTGTINTDDVNGVAVSTSGDGFNLLGVPYTSYISSQTFLTDNSNLEQTQIWVWEQGVTGGNFIAMTAIADNFILAPGQGFFVKAASGTTVNFAETNQTANADTFLKSSRTEVKLLINDGESNRFAKVYFLNNVTKGFDSGYEGETFGGIKNSLDLFSQLVEGNQGKKYQVQSLPKSDLESMVIPIGVIADAGKEITFTADALNVPSGLKVFLEDRQTNIFTRLDEANSEYKITLTETLNGVGRFYMHTTASVLSTEDIILNSVRIFKTDSSTLKITGLPKGKTSFYLYNILGKEMMTTIFTANGNKEISLSKLASGIYLAKIQTEKGAISKKIILE